MGKLVTPNNSLDFTSDEYKRLFGPGLFYTTSLTNVRLGDTPNIKAAFRFQCQQGGVPRSIHFHVMQSTNYVGYSKGDGGDIHISLCEDKDGAPDLDKKIATARWVPKTNNLRDKTTRGEFREIYLNDVKGILRTGKYYWIHFENKSTGYANNFVSVNTSGTKKTLSHSNRWIRNDVCAVYMQTGRSEWKNLTSEGSGENYFSPQFQLTYSDGRKEGTFPMESGFAVTPTVRMFRVNSAQRKIREKVQIYGTKKISGISFGFGCETPGTIRWSIVENPNNVLYTSTITEQNANFIETISGGRSNIGTIKFYDIELPNDITLNHGSTYYILFELISGSFVFGCHRNGTLTGVAYPAAYNSNTEIDTGGGWHGFYIHNEASTATDSNLQIVFHQSET